MIRRQHILAAVLLLVSIGLPVVAQAQDLEPRRWSHLPTGMTVAGLGYAYTDSFVYFSPFWQITDTSAEVNSFAVSGLCTFSMAGKSARVSVLLPYISGQWVGNVAGDLDSVSRSGFGDPRLRLSVNLYGAPALKGSEFSEYYTTHANNTVVGASVALTVPLGQYYKEELINISGNRWVIRPQIGVVHSRGSWSFELTGSAFLFGENNEFINDNQFEQRTMYTGQAHIIYDFKPGWWVSLSTAYGAGGRVYIENMKTAFEVDNWLWAANFGFPIGKRQSVRLTWLSGRTQNDVGRDSDNLLLSWSMRWAN